MDFTAPLPRYFCGSIGADGRCVAARDVPAGALVFAAEPLAFAASVPSAATRACAFCCVAKDQLLHCGTCKTPYCSKECQRWHWPIHKPECKLVLPLASHLEGDAPSALALSRLQRAIVRAAPAADSATRAFISADAQVGLARAAIERAAASADSASGTEAAAVDALRAVRLLDTEAPRASSLALAVAASACSVPATDALLRPVGVAVVPAATQLFRHSCAPNCAATFVSAEDLDDAVDAPPVIAAPATPTPLVWALRTITAVAAGTPLTHAFVDPTLPRVRRWAALASRFGAPAAAPCACAACVEGEEDFGGPLPIHPEGGSEAAELALLLRARDKASHVAYSPRDSESLKITAALAALGYDAQAVPEAPAPAAATGGLGDAFSTGLRDAVLRRESALLTFVLCRLTPRLLPPFHPDVMRVVDQLYAECALLKDSAATVLLAQHQVAFYAHACRLTPTHPLAAMQAYALADLYFNTAFERLEAAEAEAAQGPAGAAQAAQASAARPQRVEALAASLERDAPSAPAFDAVSGGGERAPELLLAEAARLFSACLPPMEAALGRGHKTVRFATSRCETLRSVVEQMAQAWGGDSAEGAGGA